MFTMTKNKVKLKIVYDTRESKIKFYFLLRY